MHPCTSLKLEYVFYYSTVLHLTKKLNLMLYKQKCFNRDSRPSTAGSHFYPLCLGCSQERTFYISLVKLNFQFVNNRYRRSWWLIYYWSMIIDIISGAQQCARTNVYLFWTRFGILITPHNFVLERAKGFPFSHILV